MSKGKIIPVPWSLWNLFWILYTLGSDNWAQVIGGVLMLWVGYLVTHKQKA